MNIPVAVARGLRRALGRRLRRFASSRSRSRSPYARVPVRVAFHGFWPGFQLGSLLAFHPYLNLNYDLVECRWRPDVHFISVGYRGMRRDARDMQREAFFDRLARRMEIVSPSNSRNNHPPIENSHPGKLAFLRHFRFNIAFENESFPGWLTEKMVDAFTAGCVPVYRGDPDVERTFSSAAFVHVRDESDYGEAIEHILAIDRDPVRLAAVRNEAPLVDNRLPDYATCDYAMAFFERIFDSAVRRP